MAYSTNPNLPKARAIALKLLIQDELPLVVVARKCGVHRSTLYRWRNKFQKKNRLVVRYLKQIPVTLAQVTHTIEGITPPQGCEPCLFLLLLNLDDVNTEALLVHGIDLAQEPDSLRLAVDLRDDLSPQLGRQHVSEVVVDTDRLDPHHARGVTGFELQQLTGLQALDVVVPDTNLQGLAT